MASLLKSTLNTRTLIKDSYRYIRSDAPFRLTDDEIFFLIENNITTIVDLRTPEEASRKPVSLKINSAFTYYNLPVTGGNAIPDTRDDVSASYLSMVDEQMRKIISSIENAASNVMFFCNAGKDRTGVVSAILLKHLGYSDEEIINDYLLSAANLHDVLEEFAENCDADIKIIMPQRRYMEEFLQRLSF